MICITWDIYVTGSAYSTSKASTLVDVVQHKDFVLSSFQIAINRCQQAALDAASAPIPCPEHQLELLRKKKPAGKEHKSNLSLYGVQPNM